MDLTEWLAAGDRTAHRLHLTTGLSLPVIARARKGRANLASAVKLHLATGRQVAISTMTADFVPPGLQLEQSPAELDAAVADGDP